MRSPRFAPVVFSIGFFALAAQTLLFRDFLVAFEGTELAIGAFFSSWLIWLSLGAACAGGIRRLVKKGGAMDSRFRGNDGSMKDSPDSSFPRKRESMASSRSALYPVVLLYLPAFFLQHWLLLDARGVLGLEAFEAISLQHLLVFSLLANSFVSFLTGFLFALACEWAQEQSALPVAWVYTLETLGSFTGAVLVTVGLELGFSPERLFLFSALVLAGGLMTVGFSRTVSLWGGVAFLVGVIPLVLGLDTSWEEQRHSSQWGHLLPKESLSGSFSTPQGEYLYGEYQSEFLVMSWGSVGESLPNEEHAGEVLALSLAQNPQARRVLIIGQGGLALSRSLSRLPQVERVTWCHFDPEFVPRILSVLPVRFREECRRIEAPAQEVTSFMKSVSGSYDLVLLNIPAPTTLVLNRFVTQEFLAQASSVLAEKGVLGLRISGGANYLGPEYAFIGASALSTLQAIFPKVVLKPGDETWFLASRGEMLSTSPGELRDRFAAISGASSLYPPDGLLSLYLPDRAAFQMRKYHEVIESVGAPDLINTETRPLGLLYGLLLLLRTTGLSLIQAVKVFGGCGLLILLVAVLLYGLLRSVYILAGERREVLRGGVSLFDNGALIFSSGLAGISLNILLLFLYQSRFGSLFLEIGLISGLFMLGIYIGGEGLRRWLNWKGYEPFFLLPVCILAHLALLVSVFNLPSICPRWIFALLFLLAGVFTGIYVPIATLRAERKGISPLQSGAWLEGFDNVGGCVGSLFTGVLLIPVLGQQAVLLFLGGLMGVQFLPVFISKRGDEGVASLPTFDRRVRTAGYWLFGVGALSLMSSQAVRMTGQADEARLFENTARELAGRETGLVSHTEQTPEGRMVHYYSFKEGANTGEHFILNSRDLGTSASGYGGPLHLAIRVDSQGILESFRVIESRETPSYLHLLENWFHSLAGKNLATPGSLREVDGVTGATLTSRAVVRTLEQSGQAFAAQVLGIVSGQPETPATHSFNSVGVRDGLLLCVFFLVALGLRWTPHVWSRRLWLVLMVVLCGGWLNLQFSIQQVFSLLSFRLPVVELSAAFFLVVLLPVLTLLFGNIYCGHLCPFGALQELIGDVRPKGIATDPSKCIFRYGRLVKYGLLFLCALAYAMTRDDSLLAVDPLVTFFGNHSQAAAFMIALTVLAASFFYPRFWCRNLCPAGAFLALLNGVRVLRGWLPRTDPARCDLGVRRMDELDCLCCDRCRHDHQ